MSVTKNFHIPLATVEYGGDLPNKEIDMGLDMYLTSKRYMSEYFNTGDKEKISTINKLFGLESVEDYHAQELVFRVAYWRKANAIHNWFVEKCQEGIDECQQTNISRERLQELVATCKTVLEDKTKAEEFLPSVSGFFFGETTYDDWYFDNVEYTADRIEKILNDPVFESCDFYYQSSW